MSILIKKYKNRRLYDTDLSQYITFDDLREYVINRRDFQVQDASTGKDLTNATLLQILLDQENAGAQLLSADILKNFIRFANHPMQQSFNAMMEQFFSGLQPGGMENPWLKNMNDWKKQFTDLFNKKI